MQPATGRLGICWALTTPCCGTLSQPQGDRPWVNWYTVLSHIHRFATGWKERLRQKLHLLMGSRLCFGPPEFEPTQTSSHLLFRFTVKLRLQTCYLLVGFAVRQALRRPCRSLGQTVQQIDNSGAKKAPSAVGLACVVSCLWAHHHRGYWDGRCLFGWPALHGHVEAGWGQPISIS